ncbi:MAG: acetylserotonin O-methyltransferase [Acidobacteria bacterium]|nr:acetylserotonin O-methyltransferase [Acidobacteriota bacterium]
MSTQENVAAAAHAEQLPPEAALMQMAFGCFVSQALYVAAKLGVADLVAEQPQHVASLAARTKTHERSLYRVLRALAMVGVFRESDDKVFGQTRLSEALRSDAPNSIRDGLIFVGEEWHWRVYGYLLRSVETGESAWAPAHGESVFDYFAAHPEEGEIFNRAMTGMSRAAVGAVTEAYDFSGVETLADIAGGHGQLLAGILRANPSMRGVLFDQAHVVEGARPLLEAEGVSGRVETVAGDFFASVPAGADAYVLKHIIHDWDDERATKILANIARSMKPGARVLVVDAVIPRGDAPHFGKLLDLEMLVSPGGVERTEDEFRDLLARAGLRLARVVPMRSYLSVVEARKEGD